MGGRTEAQHRPGGRAENDSRSQDRKTGVREVVTKARYDAEADGCGDWERGLANLRRVRAHAPFETADGGVCGMVGVVLLVSDELVKCVVLTSF